jgi:PAS domain S-box-containing protein
MNKISHILMVEDNQADVDLIREALPETGPVSFRINFVPRLSEALEQLKDEGIDLVILDLGLPDSRGLETFRKLREAAPHIPVIILTGNDDQEIAVTAVKEGAQDYLIKGQIGGSLLSRSVRYAMERKRSEETLRKSEEYFKAIIQNSSDIILIVDKLGIITYASPSIEYFLGYAPDELIGKRILDLIASDDKPRAIADFGRALLTREVPTSNIFRIKHKDGTERTLEGIGKNLLDNPIVAGFVMNVRDVTEFKQAEKILRESEERYRTLVENANDLVYRMDDTGHITYVNPSGLRIIEYKKEELIGKDYSTLIRPDMRDDAIKFFGRQFVKGINNTYSEYPILTKEGNEVWLGQNTELVVKDGQVIGFQAVSRDITERKRTEEQLQDTLESLRKAVGTTIQVLTSTVETRDPYTAGHQTRSADLARAIGTEIGLPQEKIDAIRMAGSIHDIGKLSIPAEILSKPTKLSEIEFSLIKEHSRKGFEMLKNVESPWPLAEIVYQHHERMDGSGYPRNLKGEEILIEARILAVSDVVEAMASHRPYRPGLGIDAALNEIEKNRGIFYDDAVADACLRLFREKDFQLAGT